MGSRSTQISTRRNKWGYKTFWIKEEKMAVKGKLVRERAYWIGPFFLRVDKCIEAIEKVRW